MGYDHHFKSFELPLKEQINLSYSSMKTYFACAFHYYLDYILGLQDNESTLAATLGTYSHKILQDSYKDDFSMSEEQRQEKVNLDSKAKFYASRFDIVLPKLLEEISPIDFAFIDGHHDREATLSYFKQILPFMAKGGVMLFDDIAWSDGMREAWREIVDFGVYKKIQEVGEEPWKMGVLWL